MNSTFYLQNINHKNFSKLFAGVLENAGREKMNKTPTPPSNVNTFQSPLSLSLTQTFFVGVSVFFRKKGFAEAPTRANRRKNETLKATTVASS